MRPKDTVVSDMVQYTREWNAGQDQQFVILAGIVTAVPSISQEEVEAGVQPPTGISLHVFLPGGGFFDLDGVQFTTYAAGTKEASGKWSFPQI